MLFFCFQVSHGFLCKKAALACFGCARTSSIVVDVGHSNTSVCAVEEGYVLQKSVQEVLFGSSHLTSYARSVLLSPVNHNNISSITPGYAVTRFPSHFSSSSSHSGSSTTAASPARPPPYLFQKARDETSDQRSSATYENPPSHPDHLPRIPQCKTEAAATTPAGGCRGHTAPTATPVTTASPTTTTTTTTSSSGSSSSRHHVPQHDDKNPEGRGVGEAGLDGSREESPSSSSSSSPGSPSTSERPGLCEAERKNQSKDAVDRHRKGNEGEGDSCSSNLLGVREEQHPQPHSTKEEEDLSHLSKGVHPSNLFSSSSECGRQEQEDNTKGKTAPGDASQAGSDVSFASSSTRRFRDWRHNEVVEIIACPHVTPSYREWGENHILETLTQVKLLSRQDVGDVTFSCSAEMPFFQNPWTYSRIYLDACIIYIYIYICISAYAVL